MNDATEGPTLRGFHRISGARQWSEFVREGWATVTGTLAIAAPDLPELLPAATRLRAVGSLLVEHPSTRLTRLALPALTHVRDRLDSGGVPALEAVDLPSLKSCGRLAIEKHPRLGTVNLPALKECEGLHVGANATLASLLLPSLETMHDSVDNEHGMPCLTIAGNPRLASLQLRALREVTGYFGSIAVRDNPALARLELPALTSLTAFLEVSGAASLASLVLPALRSLRGLKLSQDAVLGQVGLPALAAVDGPLEVWGNPALESLELPALERGYQLTLQDNAALARVGFPALATLGFNVHLFNNPALREFDLPVLRTMRGWLWVTDTPLLPASAVAAMQAAGACPAPGR